MANYLVPATIYAQINTTVYTTVVLNTTAITSSTLASIGASASLNVNYNHEVDIFLKVKGTSGEVDGFKLRLTDGNATFKTEYILKGDIDIVDETAGTHTSETKFFKCHTDVSGTEHSYNGGLSTTKKAWVHLKGIIKGGTNYGYIVDVKLASYTDTQSITVEKGFMRTRRLNQEEGRI